MTTVAVIIPTRNRRSDLVNCLESLAVQERPPALVLVSDASDSDETRHACRRLSTEGILRIEYLHSTIASATRQRNLALANLPEGTDFVMFCDDDVTLHPDYIRLLVELLERPENSRVAGIEGVADVSDRPRWSLALRAFYRIFSLGSQKKRGQWLRSGVNVAPPDRGDAVVVEWLFGCAMYRMSLIHDLRFSEQLRGYALYDDVDFSLQAAERGLLVALPSARLIHHESPVARQRVRASVAMQAVNRHWLLSRHGRVGWRLAYWWSILGLWILVSLRYALKGHEDNRERFIGMCEGIARVIRGQGPT